MPNDSKLGLVAGLAGVIIAAVLFYQDRPATPASVATAPHDAKPAHHAEARPNPANLFGAKPNSAKPREPVPTIAPVRVQPELEAIPVPTRGEGAKPNHGSRSRQW